MGASWTVVWISLRVIGRGGCRVRRWFRLLALCIVECVCSCAVRIGGCV